MTKEEEIEEKVTIEVKEAIIVEKPVAEEELEHAVEVKGFDLQAWNPRTKLGKLVKEKAITDIDQILDSGSRIMEAEITEALIPNLETDLLLIGQSKGKFGGGSRRVFKQVQKKTAEGNKPHFVCYAIVGNKDGYVGLGYGKAKETVPSREKAIRDAKKNIFKIARGTGSWEDGSTEPHSIPFAVTGSSGSIRLKFMPAPKGQGLVCAPECQKILRLAGIHDVWSHVRGKTTTRTNLVRACISALKSLTKTKISEDQARKANVVYGRLQKEATI